MPANRPGGGPDVSAANVLPLRPDWRPGPYPQYAPAPVPVLAAGVSFPRSGLPPWTPPAPTSRWPYPSTPDGAAISPWYGSEAHLQWFDVSVVPPLPGSSAYIRPEFPPVAVSQGDIVYRRALWASPRFDMQPMQRGIAGVPNAVPILNTGQALQVQVRRPEGAAVSGLSSVLRVSTVNYAAARNSLELSPVTLYQEIPQEFTTGSVQLALSFPWHAPYRYWSVALIFDLMSAEQAEEPPALIVTGAMQ